MTYDKQQFGEGLKSALAPYTQEQKEKALRNILHDMNRDYWSARRDRTVTLMNWKPWSKGTHFHESIKYRDYEIGMPEYPFGGYIFWFYHKDYDGWEDSRSGSGKTVAECMEQINTQIEESQLLTCCHCDNAFPIDENYGSERNPLCSKECGQLEEQDRADSAAEAKWEAGNDR